MSDKSSSSVGLGLCEVLFIVFLILKLIDKVDWSWWWVTSPMWLPLSLVVVLWVIYGFLEAISNRM